MNFFLSGSCSANSPQCPFPTFRRSSSYQCCFIYGGAPFLVEFRFTFFFPLGLWSSFPPPQICILMLGLVEITPCDHFTTFPTPQRRIWTYSFNLLSSVCLNESLYILNLACRGGTGTSFIHSWDFDPSVRASLTSPRGQTPSIVVA